MAVNGSDFKLAKQTEEALKKDFKNFLYVIWRYLRLKEPTPRQYEAADFLQDLSRKRRIIEAYRGFGKSWITSTYVLWRLYNDPNQRFLVISAAGNRAKHFTTFTQRLIETIPFLQPMIPPANLRWGKDAFDVAGSLPAHAPNVKSVGVFGQVTGLRATEIIVDDAETKNTVESETLRAKLYAALTELENIVVPGGIITYLGTPHHMDSIYSKHKLLARGYEAYIIPARYPPKDMLPHYNGFLSPKILKEVEENPELEWKPTDTRFDEEELGLREFSGGKSNFMLQYMLDTTENDELTYPLKLRDLIVFSTDKVKAPVSIRHTNEPEFRLDYTELGVGGDDALYAPERVDDEWKEYQGVFMAIDPSGRGKDQTAYAIVASLFGNLYVLDIGGYTGGYSDDVLHSLAQKVKEYNVKRLFIEANYGDGMFSKIFQPILKMYVNGIRIEEIKHSHKKEERIIDTLEPIFNMHRLIIEENVIKHEYALYFNESQREYSILYQITNLTREKDCLVHDDKIDALAMTVQAWKEVLGLDPKKMVEEHRKRQLLELLNKRRKLRSPFNKNPKKHKDLRERKLGL